MTHEEFVSKNTLIAERLNKLAVATERMAWFGSAHTDNPRFRELMAAQNQLIKAADRLLEEYDARKYSSF
jgi:hypothetical protein